MEPRLSKKNKNKKTKIDPIIEHLKEEIGKSESYIKWLEKNISEHKTKIAQNRKVLEKLRKIK